jgi:predicted transcriptional regulator
MQRKERRTKLKIFYDILTELKNESISGEIKPTRVQQKCNMSYDKFAKNIIELRSRKLISDDQTFRITDRGIQLINDYNKINSFLTKMKLEYIQMEEINAN